MKLVVLFLGALSLAAQTPTAIQWLQQDPLVSRPGQNSVLRACVRNATITRVTLEGVRAGVGPSNAVDFVNQGSCLWTVNFTTPTPSADDYFRPDFAFVRAYAGSTLVETLNFFPQIYTNELPLYPVISLGPAAQRTNYVVNIVEPRTFPANGSNLFQPDFAAATSRFYQVLPDDFDMLNIVFARNYPVNRFHTLIRSTASGVGQAPVALNADTYGSAARLLGLNVYPSPLGFDGAERAQAHEFAHQWINHVRSGILEDNGAHWPASTMALGVMGSNSGAFNCVLRLENGQLTASTSLAPKTFNPLDLYLMGLIPASEVPDQYVVTDSTIALNMRNGNCTRPPLDASQFQTVRIAEVVSSLGPRLPAAGSAPRNYRLATLVVSDRLLNAEEMAFFSHFARRAEDRGTTLTKVGFGTTPSVPIYVASGGRLSVDTRIVQQSVPEIPVGGVVNGASFNSAQPNAPGGLSSIFGVSLSTVETSAPALPLTSTLGGTRVFVNGQAAPLFYVGPGQINFVMPENTTASPSGLITVRVENGVGQSNLTYATLRSNAPAIFTYGDRRAIAVDLQNRLITENNPARTGQFVTLYLTGIGPTNPPVNASEASPTSPLAQCTLRPQIRMPGTIVSPSFCGLTPGLVGLAQMNFLLPPSVPEGDQALDILWGTTTSNTVILRVAR